jgi:hypothetical protein
MKTTTCKVSAPSIGRGGDNGIPDCPIREAETLTDLVELAGSEENAVILGNKAYVIEFQKIRRELKADGSTDDYIREQGPDYVWEGPQKGGGGGFSRAHATNRVLTRWKSEGKESFNMADLDAAVEEELELAKLEREEENNEE